jgi:transposase
MGKTHAPYAEAFRAEAVELARTSGKSIPALAGDLGISEQALRDWVRRAAGDAGQGPAGAATDERAELARLRHRVRVLEQEREILKKAAAFFAKEATP